MIFPYVKDCLIIVYNEKYNQHIPSPVLRPIANSVQAISAFILPFQSQVLGALLQIISQKGVWGDSCKDNNLGEYFQCKQSVNFMGEGAISSKNKNFH